MERSKTFFDQPLTMHKPRRIVTHGDALVTAKAGVLPARTLLTDHPSVPASQHRRGKVKASIGKQMSMMYRFSQRRVF